MSITPKQSLSNLVQGLFRGDGTDITLYDRVYTLREFGDLSLDDPSRKSMFFYLKNQAYIRPRKSNQISLDFGDSCSDDRAPTCKVTFTRAEHIPPAEQDTGSHQYFIVEGARYRLDIEGDMKKVGTHIHSVIDVGRKMIKKQYEENNQFHKIIEIKTTLENVTLFDLIRNCLFR